MPIVSTQIINKGVQKDSRLLVQYQLTDNIGLVHVIPTRKVAATFDTAADILYRAGQKDIELQENEIVEQLAELDKGNTPPTPKYQTKAAALKKVLKFILNFDRQEIVEHFKAVQFVSTLTDTQLRNGLNITQAKVDIIRARLLTIAEAQTRLDAYVPPGDQ